MAAGIGGEGDESDARNSRDGMSGHEAGWRRFRQALWWWRASAGAVRQKPCRSAGVEGVGQRCVDDGLVGVDIRHRRLSRSTVQAVGSTGPVMGMAWQGRHWSSTRSPGGRDQMRDLPVHGNWGDDAARTGAGQSPSRTPRFVSAVLFAPGIDLAVAGVKACHGGSMRCRDIMGDAIVGRH